MKKPSTDNLGFGERVVLYLLGGIGLLVWAIVMLFAVKDRNPLPQGLLPPPLVRTAVPTFTATPDLPPTSPWTPWPTWTPGPTATYTATPAPTAMPYGVTMLPIDGDVEVIAVLGIDEEHDATVWRTDAIILAFVDRKAKRLSLLSIPRDLWVHIPGYADNRINTVDALGERSGYPGGGIALLDRTLRFNLGIPVHHWVKVDFMGFINIIDAIGGITVNVERPITDHFPDPTSPSGWAWLTLPQGPRHMDGSTALSYCRSRVTTSDFDRSSRQQQVIMAVWKKMLTLETLARAPQLWSEFDSAFNTDLQMDDAIQLAYFAQSLDPEQIQSQHLDFSLTRDWTTAQGAQVLLPKTDEIRAYILELVAPPG